MLSIGKIALGQHRYYEQQVAHGQDDYYTGRGESPGEWAGAGAKALGLTGRVGAGQFGALIAGHDPRDPATRLRSSAHDPKVAAYDLTFSAPKTLSILFAIAPEQVSGELVGCHEEAVRAAHTWREEVRARAGEQGLDTGRVAELLGAGRDRLVRGLAGRGGVDEQVLGARLTGADGLTERSNTFDERAVLQEFAAAAGAGALVGEVRGQAERFTGRPDVIAARGGEMTTAELVAVERRLIAAAIGRAGEGAGIIDPSLAERTIAVADRPLTTEQAAAVRAVTGSGHGVSVIQALAGTGKTYTAGVLRQIYESAGYPVLGVAPTGRAVRELAEEAGIPTRTLDRLLIDLEQLGDELPKNGVLILDEAGMAATRPTARLLEAAEKTGVKVVAIGDPGQLASVQAGGWLGAVGRALGAQRLTEVMRQRDPAERRALGALHDGQPQRYVNWAERNGRIETFSDPAGACEQTLVEWASAATGAIPAQTVMIARDNDTRERLNRDARELRRGLGALGQERSYGSIEVAVGDRVICRHNDGQLDVDNGMRGTVRHLDPDRVVIDTDGGLVRELPAAYVAEHVEHAYSLTGHGMQGGTVQSAIVVASPRDLTAGWSYTALSRARETTRLLVYDDDLERERSEFAPTDQTPTATRDELLDRVARRMQERDDEDLAIEQLPGAGRTDDHDLTSARAHAIDPPQEHAAARAEPTPPAAATPTRLRELRERVEQLQAQLAALPTRQLQRIEDLNARALRLTSQREQLTGRLAGLPEPQRRLGREHDAHAIERAHLTSALQANERELDAALTQRNSVARELGDPVEARAEREGLEHAITQATREHTALRNELAERELHTPAAWVKATFGERPDRPAHLEAWKNGVRHATRYRAQYDITNPTDPLGPRPEQRGAQQRDWERARDAIDRAERRLGREVSNARDIDLGIGR